MKRLLAGSCLLILLASGRGALSGALTDGSLGLQVELAGDFAIGAGLGTRRGDNLFHSFARFSIEPGESATFLGPDDIRNVVSRVTGGAPSRIDGMLRSEVGSADLYFINPAGVVFGPNAVLDVPASFHVSTADGLRFADGRVFSASDPAASSLSVAAPEAFGFLGGRPAGITIDRSLLLVPRRHDLSVVGGDLTLIGGEAPGQGLVGGFENVVTLVAVAGRGAVRIADGQYDGARLGAIRMLPLVTVGALDGGIVRIRAALLRLRDADILSIPMADLARPGLIDIAAGTIVMIGDSNIAGDPQCPPGLTCEPRFGADIALRADAIFMLEGSSIASATFGEADSGSITIEAGRLVILSRVDGDFTGITTTAQSGSAGAAGPITIHADQILMAGQVEISSGANGTGPAGTITIVSDRLEMRDQASISTTSFSAAPGGDVDIVARDQLVIAGDLTGITAAGAGAGGSGTISLRSDDIRIERGVLLAASLGAGPAGGLAIRADDLILDDALLLTDSAAAGGGTIFLRGGDFVDLHDSEVTTSVAGGADPTAGDILIRSPALVIDGSRIKADARTGFGGKVALVADHLLVPRGDFAALLARDEISASGGDPTRAGSIVVDALEVDPGSDLVILEVPLLNAAALLRARCAARRHVGASSFTRAGRGGLPPTPEAPLPSVYGVDGSAAGADASTTRAQPAIVLLSDCARPS